MEKNIITLKGGQVHITEDPKAAFLVEEGSALVYVLPVEKGQKGRRLFLCEVEAGEAIPAFNCSAIKDIHDDEPCMWHFAVAALDSCRIREYEPEDPEALKKSFAEKADLRFYDTLGFEEAVLEFYRLEYMRSLRTIYVTEQEQKKSYTKGLHTIYDVFKKNSRFSPKPHLSGSPLYDVCEVVCERLGCHIAPLESVRESAGHRFGVEDVARVSHFSCRRVILEENWHRQDGGVLICFTSEGNKPVACIPKGPSSYVAYDGETGNVSR